MGVNPWRAAIVVLGSLLIIVMLGRAAIPQDNCTEFGFRISNNCCCTNGCCREAQQGEVEHVEGDTYRIVPSGQLIQRTGWSPDGRTIRCACDQIDGKWTVHSRAHTRCLYMPMPNS